MTSEVLILGVKAVMGGTFVLLFALLGEMAVPKRFAGLFSAAPSVALGSLLVILVTLGAAEARMESAGMVIGAVAMLVVFVAGMRLIPRWRAVRESAAVCTGWLIIAVAGYALAFR